jgi:hypothetical protein
MPKKSQKKPKPRGRKPEVLVIERNWKEAVKKSFEKTAPEGGWPKPERGAKRPS